MDCAAWSFLALLSRFLRTLPLACSPWATQASSGSSLLHNGFGSDER